MTEPFMEVIVRCLEKVGTVSDDFIPALRAEFGIIETARPHLSARYAQAIQERDVGEIERLLMICKRLLRDHNTISISNLHVRTLTGKFDIGNGLRRCDVFPRDS